MDCRQVDTWVVRAVWEALSRRLGYPPAADDRLWLDRMFDPEDEDMDFEVLREILHRTYRSVTHYPAAKVPTSPTVREWITCISRMPRSA
jgi:hypothetical protein